MVGPQARSKSWEAPLHKYSTAARDWGKLGLGFYYSSLAYSIYVLPILSFVAQLSAPPVEAYAAEEKALRDIIPGPYRWILPEDLFHAGDLYGQGRSFPSLAILAKAAQARVYRLEAFRRGGLKVADKCEEAREILLNSEFQIMRLSSWNHWYRHGPVQTLEDNRAALSLQGLTMSSLWAHARGEADDDTPGDVVFTKTKKKFQRTVTKELGAKVSVDSKTRMRSKLDRWNLPGNQRVTANRCLEALAVLKRRSSPKIAAAFLRTLWNGWLTGRRFQIFRGCMFCCGEFSHEDSLEHYSSCATIHKFRKTFLSPLQTVDGNAQGCLITMGLHFYALQDDFIVARGLLNYICYRTHCELVHKPVHSEEDVLELMQQYSLDATRSQSMGSLHAHYPSNRAGRDLVDMQELLDTADDLE